MNNSGGMYQFTGGMTRAVRLLLIANIAVYVVQVLMDKVTGGLFTALFALSRDGVGHGRVWQLGTYMFLHGSLLHLLMNMLYLFFLGPETERTISTRQFYILYFLSGTLAGLGWLLVTPYARCVGASGAIFAVLVAFATLYPHRMMTLLLFFVLPVTIKAWVLVAGLVGIELFFLVGGAGGHVAHLVHLGGALVGYVYTTTVLQPGSPGGFRIPRPGRKRFKVLRGGGGRPPPGQVEIDAILEKIARKGVSSLSPREKRILESASKDLRSR